MDESKSLNKDGEAKPDTKDTLTLLKEFFADIGADTPRDADIISNIENGRIVSVTITRRGESERIIRKTH